MDFCRKDERDRGGGLGGAPRPQHRLPPPALVDFARQGPDRDAAISSGWTVA